jgi:T6SS, Phospholipase effector Tle1-like, catalytic domain
MHEDDFKKIEKSDLEEIVSTIFFQHYLRWYRDFWEPAQIAEYEKYLEVLFEEFKENIGNRKSVPIVDSHSQVPFKHIFIGIDGTFQAAFRDTFQSNVHRMNLALDHQDQEGNSQIFIYSAGVGAFNRSSRLYAGALGEGLNSLILNAYINLASNYVQGDKIYIFGFSRGALAARVLTGFVSYCGLLKPNKLSLIHHAWRDFTRQEARDFDFGSLRSEARKVQVEFLGVWDTVPGPFKFEELRRSYRFESLRLDPIVKCGIHILSIDEGRASFCPLLWDRCENHQTLEQTWFPGVHSDIGGGYGAAFLSTISLLFMIERLSLQCPDLSLDDDYINDVLLATLENEEIEINDEWGKWFVPPRKLVALSCRTVDALPEHRHFVHSLVALLTDKKIAIRSQKAKYRPSFSVINSTKLTQADFSAETKIGKRVQDILEHKISHLNANSQIMSPVIKVMRQLRSLIARH